MINEFDEWRTMYDSMSYLEQIYYHNDLEKRYPEQAHYNYSAVQVAFFRAVREPKVLEFGPWKGDLANQAIPEFNVKEWLGIEICEDAVNKSKCKLSQYRVLIPFKFDWWKEERIYKADILVATHFIEHLSNDHFDQLTQYFKGIPVIYFEAPLEDDGQTWEGYVGTHKMTYGWKDIVRIMKENGYEVSDNLGIGKVFVYQ